jgi:hypothetical protein
MSFEGEQNYQGKPLELDDGRGLLFKNRRKTEDKHPGYVGQFRITGEMYDRLATNDGYIKVAMWAKKDKNQNWFFSLKASEPYQGKPPEQRPAGYLNDDLDDEIPFP